MTDRELLEAAARAAAIKIDFSETNGGGIGNTGFDVLGNPVLDWHNGTTWNPLIDAGDALRLAVKLRIDLHFEEEYVGGEWIETAEVMCLRDRETGSSHCPMHSLDDDPAATVRRLIVEAAAAIHTSKSKGDE